VETLSPRRGRVPPGKTEKAGDALSGLLGPGGSSGRRHRRSLPDQDRSGAPRDGSAGLPRRTRAAYTPCRPIRIARLMENHLLESGYDLRLGAALARVETSDGLVRLNFGALRRGRPGARGTACEESPNQEDFIWWCVHGRVPPELPCSGRGCGRRILVTSRCSRASPPSTRRRRRPGQEPALGRMR